MSPFKYFFKLSNEFGKLPDSYGGTITFEVRNDGYIYAGAGHIPAKKRLPEYGSLLSLNVIT